jgi:ubiquinone/menaquinone biosynthesis C-methylase UbiE
VAVTEQQVHDYWQADTCGSVHADAERFSKEYFDQIEAHRYRVEPFIHDFARFGDTKGKRVLEIGVGAATDFVNFARAGAELTGVDLTPAAIEHARHRLDLEGLDARLLVATAEQLPFEDGEFDVVYSWGVLHHAAHPERTFEEVRRVLAPDGEARVMLYGRHSWVAYKLWVKGTLIAAKHRRRPPTSLREAVANHMESPGTQCYTREELVEKFSAAGFTNVEVEGFLTSYDQEYLGPLARRMRRDWFLGVRAS